MGRYLSQPLKQQCADFAELRSFLSRCEYVSDEEQFAKKDYWQAPELFEESKKGDCEDFALWAWRQLLEMHFSARVVIGFAGQYGDGHAWVTFEQNGKWFLLEPLAWPVGLTLPRLSIVRYKPKYSVGWDGRTISYFEHEDRKFNLSLSLTVLLCAEWLFFWTKFWLPLPIKIAKVLTLKLTRRKPIGRK